MEIVHISRWSNQQVLQWFQGLDESLQRYVEHLRLSELVGEQLLILNIESLHKLQIHLIGHQELILDAVSLLQQLDNGLSSDTLQSRAICLNCRCRQFRSSISNRRREIEEEEGLGSNPLQQGATNHLLELAGYLLEEGKQVILWLERVPFNSKVEFREIRTKLVRLCYELSVTMQQSVFACVIEDASLSICCDIEKSAESIIQCSDPLVVQPVTLERVCFRDIDPSQGIGIFIKVTFEGHHVVTGTRPGSVASKSRRIASGDEVIAVNGRAVIGWTLSSLVSALKEKKDQVILLMRKQPQITTSTSSFNFMAKLHEQEQHDRQRLWRVPPSIKQIDIPTSPHTSSFFKPARSDQTSIRHHQPRHQVEQYSRNTWNICQTPRDHDTSYATCHPCTESRPLSTTSRTRVGSYRVNLMNHRSSDDVASRDHMTTSPEGKRRSRYLLEGKNRRSSSVGSSLRSRNIWTSTSTASSSSVISGDSKDQEMTSSNRSSKRTLQKREIGSSVIFSEEAGINPIDILRIPPPPIEPYEPKSSSDSERGDDVTSTQSRPHSPNSLLDMETNRRHTIIGDVSASSSEAWYQTFLDKVRECNAVSDVTQSNLHNSRDQISTRKNFRSQRPLSMPLNGYKQQSAKLLHHHQPIVEEARRNPKDKSYFSVNINNNNRNSVNLRRNRAGTPPKPPPRSATTSLSIRNSADVSSFRANSHHPRQASLPCQKFFDARTHPVMTSPSKVTPLNMTSGDDDVIPVPRPRTSISRKSDHQNYENSNLNHEVNNQSKADDSSNIINKTNIGEMSTSKNDPQDQIHKSSGEQVAVKTKIKLSLDDAVTSKKDASEDIRIFAGTAVRLRPKINYEKTGLSTLKSDMRTQRRVSCRDLGQGDCEGWLWKKKTDIGLGSTSSPVLSSKWSKRWVVIKNFAIYCFRSNETDDERKAECYIRLPGYQVMPAPECKRKFAFKIINLKRKTFYFAAERQTDMSRWMNKMGLAAIEYDYLPQDQPQNSEKYHSESDNEIDPKTSQRNHKTPKKILNSVYDRKMSHSLDDLVKKTASSRSTTPPPDVFQSSDSSKAFLSLGESKDQQKSTSDKKEPDISVSSKSYFVNRMRTPKHQRSKTQPLQDHSSSNSFNHTSKPSAPEKSSNDKNSVVSSLSSSSSNRSSNISLTSSSRRDTMGRPQSGSNPDSVGDDASVQDLCQAIKKADIDINGTDRKTSLRRKMTLLSRDPVKNELMLKKRALERELKAKEQELEYFDKLLGRDQSDITHEILHSWIDQHISLVSDLTTVRQLACKNDLTDKKLSNNNSNNNNNLGRSRSYASNNLRPLFFHSSSQNAFSYLETDL